MQPDHFAEPEGVPVFKPTYEEFKDFKTFVQSIEHYGQRVGLAKVIPPKEWLDQQNTSFEQVEKLVIKRPISQEFNCGGLPAGAQRQFNIETKKLLTVKEWFQLSLSDQYSPPSLNGGKLIRKPLIKTAKRKKHQKTLKAKKQKMDDPESTICVEEASSDESDEELDYKQTPEIYTPEYMKELERFYWRNVSFQETMYGADLPGSVFTSNPENKWNVACLENLLRKYPQAIPGVNLPYLYFGMYKATFAWHVEDMDLNSINYIHFGAPKQWYVIPPTHRERFERFAQGLFYDESKKCTEFLRHKTCVISPQVIEKQNIPVHRVIQNEHEFILTFPGGYHQGYNAGFNCAESVNFAYESWIPYGQKAKSCKCEKDSVTLDVEMIINPPEHVPENYLSQYINADLRRITSRKPVKEEYIHWEYALPKGGDGKSHKKYGPTPILPAVKCQLCLKGDEEKYPLLPTDQEGKFCHKVCADHVLETRTEIVDDKMIVKGLEDIPRGRWGLKCIICHVKPQIGKRFVGACIQCSKV
ncbi:JmjC domain, hydroxylase-domain-containing protein [Gorgonomyces haynaldii]|nr:JmjC domain, hydroxylase-domain-containing protein [Gorgonomyces haynaldii]